MSDSGILNNVYNGAAEIGDVTSMISLIVGIIIGVVSIICAIVNFTSSSSTKPLSSEHNNHVKTTTMSPTTTGVISLVLALIIIGFSSLNYYLTINNKDYAALQGAQDVANIF